MWIEATNDLQIFPNRFKLNPDQNKKIGIKFISKIIGEFNIDVTLIPRGGQKRVIQSTIKVVEPQLKFSSEYI